MPSRRLLIDEWLLHDLQGDNGRLAQARAGELLEKIRQVCDHIVLRKGSRWAQKAYELMKYNDPIVRDLSKYLHLVILRDPGKCRVLEGDHIPPLPAEVERVIPPHDLYLLETYATSQAELFITTDTRLLEILGRIDRFNVNVALKELFLEQYLVDP